MENISNYEALLEKYNNLQSEYDKIVLECQITKERLKKYTAPARKKNYYEAHKEELQQKSREYMVTKEKKKEYNQRYSEKKKAEKIQKLI